MANKYSYYQLRTAHKQRMLASLYAEPDDPDAFNAGYVEALTPRHVLLWAVTPWGQQDGWILRRTEDVLQVFMGDDFEIRMQMLLELGGITPSPLLPMPLKEEDDLLQKVLAHAQEHKALISIMTSEDTYTGTVTHLDDLRATLLLLDFFGAEDGTRQFPLREMQILTIGTQEEAMYQRLHAERLRLL